MIVVSSSGKSFAALMRYLLTGRTGDEPNRVAWIAVRNLPTDDPQLAVTFMRATASQSERVQKPVYHLALAFDPADPVDRAAMEAIATRLLGRLGLSDHQALIVAHSDREHPHLHILINRVHPETRRAWDRWQDQPAIQALLREEEQRLGLREVPGKLAPRVEQTSLDLGAIPPDTAPAGRAANDALVASVRGRLADLRECRSWDELETRLAAADLQLSWKAGQGLVISDGKVEVRASRIASDLALSRLEATYEEVYPGRRAAVERSPAVDAVARDLKAYDHALDMAGKRHHADADLSATRARADLLEAAIGRARITGAEFRRMLGEIYQDGPAAQRAFREVVDRRGLQAAIDLVHRDPEQLGALRAVERPQFFGLVSRSDDRSARAALPRLGAAARDALEAEQAMLSVVIDVRARRLEEALGRELRQLYRDPEAAAAAFASLAHERGPTAAATALRDTPQSIGPLRPQLEHGPQGRDLTANAAANIAIELLSARAATKAGTKDLSSPPTIDPTAESAATTSDLARARDWKGSTERAARDILQLEHGIRRAVALLEPRELKMLRLSVSRPHYVLAMKLRNAVRDMALGRDEMVGR